MPRRRRAFSCAIIEHMFDNFARRAGERDSHPSPYRADMPPLSAHAVAAAIRARKPDVGTLTLHKLLYYAQGHHLADFGHPLFSDSVSAYDNGPIVGRFWFAERHDETPPVSRQPDEAELNTMGFVLSRYGHLTGPQLIDKTHGEAPWQRADETRPPGGRVRIEESWMQEFFQSPAVPALSRRSEIAEAAMDAEPADLSVKSDDLDLLRTQVNRAVSGG